MHLAHVFIGRFDLPVPLSAVLVAAMAVVAASFGLIYLIPPRTPEPEKPGPLVPRAVVMGLQVLAVLTVVYLVVVGIFGRQVTILNGATIFFWVLAIPLLPLVHCIVGGMYEVANPFALGARLLTAGRSARVPRNERLDRLGYWPAVAMLFLLVWFELALTEVPASPRTLGILTLIYAVFQVGMGAWLGRAGTAAASCSPQSRRWPARWRRLPSRATRTALPASTSAFALRGSSRSDAAARLWSPCGWRAYWLTA